jgi:uncharacterized protein
MESSNKDPMTTSPGASPADDAFIGRVIGTEDSTPLDFWVALAPGRTVQLDDVVALERVAPGRARADLRRRDTNPRAA